MRLNPFTGDQGLLTEEEMLFIENKIVETFRFQLKARSIFPVRELGQGGGVQLYRYYTEEDPSEAGIDMTGKGQSDDHPEKTAEDVLMPVIHKEFFLNWRDVASSKRSGEGLVNASIRTATRKVAEAEDRLLISGETDGWDALGIEGLFTARDRTTVAVSGNWPANFIADLNTGRAALDALGFEGVEPILIAPPAIINGLDALIANTTSTYMTAALENNLLADAISTSSAYAADGGVDSALLVIPGQDNFYAVSDLALMVNIWYDKTNNVYGTIRETIAPVIARGTSIYELEDVVIGA